jgi:hypothetical protein
MARAAIPYLRKLTLGSDAYELIHAALTERLADLEVHKGLAHSTGIDARHPSDEDPGRHDASGVPQTR